MDERTRAIIEQLKGTPEATASLLSGAVAEPIAGLHGLSTGISGAFRRAMRGEDPRGALDDATSQIERTREALTFQPRSSAGQRQQAAMGRTMEPVAEALEYLPSKVGEYSPEAGALLAGGMAAGVPKPLRAGKTGAKAARTAKAAKEAVAAIDETQLPPATVEAPTRSKRRVETTGQYVGAPPGVDSPQKLAAMVRDYQKAMVEGLAGRHFYRDSSADIWARTGHDPVQADLLSQNLAALSRANNVGGNTFMSTKGHVQAMTGEPVSTGRFPSRDSPPLQEMYSRGNTDYLGHKREPFAEQLSVQWAPERIGRGVNDMHEAELMGYPSGTVGGPTQHAFMDEVRARAIEQADRSGLGGIGEPWNTGTAQAAAWSGNKIRRGDIKPGDAARSYADYFPEQEANATYEAVSSPVTGHLQGLLEAPYDVKQAYTLDPRGSWNTSPSGRDIGYTAAGLLPGETAQTVGRFKGTSAPSMTARPVVGTDINYVPHPEGRLDPKGKPVMVEQSRTLTPGSRKALDLVEGSRAYFDAQEAGAWHKLMPAARAGDVNALTLNEQMSPELMQRIAPQLEAMGYDVISNPAGATVAAFPWSSATAGADMRKIVSKALREAGIDKPALDPGRLESGYLDYADAWKSGQGGAVANELLKLVDAAPKTAAKLEQSEAYRAAVRSRNLRDTEYAGKGYGTHLEGMARAREIFAKEGWDGIRRAAKAGIIPAAALAILAEQGDTE